MALRFPARPRSPTAVQPAAGPTHPFAALLLVNRPSPLRVNAAIVRPVCEATYTTEALVTIERAPLSPLAGWQPSTLEAAVQPASIWPKAPPPAVQPASIWPKAPP